MGMFGKLIQVVARIIIALDYRRTIRRKAHVPSDIADLRHYERSLCAHLADLVPHRELKALDGGTCLRVMREKVLALVYRVIRYLTGLLIHGSCHASAVEVIDSVSVVAEPYAGAGDVDFAFLLDGYDPHRIEGMRVESSAIRMLDKDLFEQMRAFLMQKPFIQMLRRLSGAVDHLHGLSAGSQVSLGYELVMVLDKSNDCFFVVFPYRDPLACKEFTEMLVELYLVIYEMSVLGIVIFVDQVVAPASGDIGISLLIREVIHLIEPVIHISGAELSSAVRHIEKYPQTALTRLLVDILDLGVHRLKIHAHNTSNQIFNTRHDDYYNTTAPFLL